MAGSVKVLTRDSHNPDSDVACYTLGGIVLDTTLGNCDMVCIKNIRTLSVKPVSGGAAITTLTFYGCDTATGTFVLINDLGTNGVVTVVDSVWQAIDRTKLEPHFYIQMKPSANGTATVVGKN